MIQAQQYLFECCDVDHVKKVYKELYMPSDSNDPASDIYIIVIIKGVFTTEKERTNNWLAAKLGMNKTTVSKWCTNQMQPTMETLFAIAEALDVDARDLIVSTKK